VAPAKKIEKVIIYTDGSCDPNPGPGGWAAIILENGSEKILKGSEPKSTNNRMEMTAALQALRYVDSRKPLMIYTDSQYLKNGVESWLKDWKARNWKRQGGALMNVDLWKEISVEVDQRKITWKWIRGHVGNPYNERVDRLARQMMRANK
jgi:ribonuclease HI